MKRRRLDLQRDCASLMELHRYSWSINFPDQDLSELAFLQSLRSGAERHEVFVYECEGELVAWLWLDLMIPLLGTHIRHLQVARSHWGQGIGRQLVEDAIALSRERSAPWLTLNVTKANCRAMALYQGLGFEVAEDHGDRQKMKLSLR